VDLVVLKLKAVENPGKKHMKWEVSCACGHVVGVPFRSRKSSGTDFGPDIQAALSHQLGITKRLLLEIVSCKKSRPEYLQERGHAGCSKSTISSTDQT
jgi:hypothetical protein